MMNTMKYFYGGVLVLFSIFAYGDAEIYIVTMEGEPVMSYQGGIDGFEATAADTDEKVDVTRYANVRFKCFY